MRVHGHIYRYMYCHQCTYAHPQTYICLDATIYIYIYIYCHLYIYIYMNIYIYIYISSSRADSIDFPDSLSLSLSLSLTHTHTHIHTHTHKSLLIGPLDSTQCPHRADGCKSLMVAQHCYRPCVGVHRRSLFMSSSLFLLCGPTFLLYRLGWFVRCQLSGHNCCLGRGAPWICYSCVVSVKFFLLTFRKRPCGAPVQ